MCLVLGMMVGYLFGNQFMVNYYGISMLGVWCLQVLIDGCLVYCLGFVSVDWSDLLLVFEDVEWIEVFCGLNIVSYGVNVLMGVINIIICVFGELFGMCLKYMVGQCGICDWYVSQSIVLEDSDFCLLLFGQEDDGFDCDYDGYVLCDGCWFSCFNFNVSYSLVLNQSLEW